MRWKDGCEESGRMGVRGECEDGCEESVRIGVRSGCEVEGWV